MNKEQILKQCDDLINDEDNFNKAVAKFKKKYPRCYIGCNFYKEISGNIFKKKYGNSLEFFKPRYIEVSDGVVKVKCEAWSLFCWSAYTVNVLNINEFNNLVEVSREYVEEECKKQKKRHIDGMNKLKKDTMKKLNDVEQKDGE